jgi:hypothetical protein
MISNEITLATMPNGIWEQKLHQIQEMFDGGTSEIEENLALTLILASGSSSELIYLINNLTWSRLDDELEEPDLDQIATRLSDLMNREQYLPSFLQKVFQIQPDDLKNVSENQLTSVLRTKDAASLRSLADELLSKRDIILNDIGLRALRGLPLYDKEFFLAVDHIRRWGVHRLNELLSFRWEGHYTRVLCRGLEAGDVKSLLQSLPDLINPDATVFPIERRMAFKDMLRRWDRELFAMDDFVKQIVDFDPSKNEMAKFLRNMRLFTENFPYELESPNIIEEAIQQILAALGAVAGTFDDLVSAIRELVAAIQNINLQALMNTDEDDIAVNTTNAMAAETLALLPTRYKYELINRMLLVSAEDEEEQAILRILATSKERSPAEFVQLVSETTWEKLYNSFDGTEYDSLEGMFFFRELQETPIAVQATGKNALLIRGEYEDPEGDERINLFVRGGNGNMWEYFWNGERWKWTDTGQSVAGSPAGVIRGEYNDPNGDIRMNVFVKGGNGNLWEYFWNGSYWDWKDTGNGVAGNPVVIIRGNYNEPEGDVRINVFVRGVNGNLCEYFWNGSHWDWKDTGHPITGDPTGVIRGDYRNPEGNVRINIFVRGANGNLCEYFWNGHQWNWTDTGQLVTGDPAVVIRGEYDAPNGTVYLNVFVPGPNGNLWEYFWNGHQWLWNDTDRRVAGKATITVRGEVNVLYGNIRMNIFVQGFNGNLLEYFWNGSQWVWSDTGHAITGDPTAIIRGEYDDPEGDVRINVFVPGSNGNLWEYFWNGQQWVWSECRARQS